MGKGSLHFVRPHFCRIRTIKPKFSNVEITKSFCAHEIVDCLFIASKIEENIVTVHSAFLNSCSFSLCSSFLLSLILMAHKSSNLSWRYSPLQWAHFCSGTVFKAFSVALVACADFLLCVFLCDGTVALCSCLQDTKTFGLGYTKACVRCHVAMAPGGAWRWWRGGRTWHTAHTPWPCHTGKALSWWCTPGRCFFRWTLWRFYAMIRETIYWLSVWHTCTHTHAKPSRQEQTHTNTEKHKQEEKWDIKQQQNNESRTQFGKNMQRITRLYIKHSVHIYIQQHVWSPRRKQRMCREACSLGIWQVCVCVCVCLDCLLTILVHGMRFRLLLANISKGAHNRDAVGQFLVVLMVVLFEQRITDPLPGILTHRARHLVLIQNHVWFLKKHSTVNNSEGGFHITISTAHIHKVTPDSVCICVAASDAKLIILTKTDRLLLI